MAEPSNNYGRRVVYSAKFNTEGGMNRQEKAAVLSWEGSKRNMKTERVAAFDSQGRIIYESKSGSRNRTGLVMGYNYKDSIITHNHPTSSDIFGFGLASRIGNSFSGQDLAAAVSQNAKEMRVVTGGYTFSMRRPKNGWGVSAQQVMRDYNDLMRDRRSFASSYIRGGGSPLANLDRQGRYNVATHTSVWRELAKKYGWTYARRKNG